MKMSQKWSIQLIFIEFSSALKHSRAKAGRLNCFATQPKDLLNTKRRFYLKGVKLSVPLFHQSLDICLQDILFPLKSIKVCFSSFTAQDVLSIMGRQQWEVEPKRKMKMAKLTGDEMTVQRRNKTENTTSAFCDIDTQDSPKSSQQQPVSISPSRVPREQLAD